MNRAKRPEGKSVVVVGGGAAGFFAAIACAEADPLARVEIHEATSHTLAKVRISGGGRCNVTHACFEPRQLARYYPRGSRELIGPFSRFGPTQTLEWFESRSVGLKSEADGRMFPLTDDSATVVNCLTEAARKAGIGVVLRSPLRSAVRDGSAGFVLDLGGREVRAGRVLLATGGGRDSAGMRVAAALGHAIEPPVPSLFTFHIEDPRLHGLEGVSSVAEVSVEGTRLRESGPVLVTHWGLSGPAVLRLSAWGARALNGLGYSFTLRVNWCPGRTPEQVRWCLEAERASHPGRQVGGANPFSIPGRLWERLTLAAGIADSLTWSGLANDRLRSLAAQACGGEFKVTGKSMNKDEFVTCGGVRLSEVDMATMESRICPGLYFAGEVLDIDGITGGFNFQAAWTTGWHAGRAMALR